MPEVRFATDAGSAPGYLAVPSAAGPSHAMLLLPEPSTTEEHTRPVCDRLAREGFFALAPNRYRIELDARRAEAVLPLKLAEGHVRGALRFLTTLGDVQGPGLGVIGFGLGGGLALAAASASPEIAAAVVYYCILPSDCALPRADPDFERIACPVLGHFGTADSFISLRDAKALEMRLREAGVAVTFEKHTGAGDAFLHAGRSHGAYDELAAQHSWQRTLGFLRQTLSADARLTA